LKKSRWMRRFVARYIAYLEVFGYLFVVAMATTIAALWLWKVDDVSQAHSNPLIKPHEYVATHPADVVLLNMLVQKHDEVTEGQPIAEICDDPAWVSRYASAQQALALAAALDNNAAKGARVEGEDMLRGFLRNSLAQWETQRPAMPRVKLLAPHSGVAVIDNAKEGLVIPAEEEIARIIDFEDLRISGDFRGTNQSYARLGQPTRSEILMAYGNNETLLSDIERPGAWTNGYGQFNSVAEGKINDILKQHFAGKRVTMEDDTTFTLTKVTAVELRGTFQTEKANASAAGEDIAPEPFTGIEIMGRVIEGAHTASVRVLDLPEDVQSAVKQAVLQRFESRPIRLDDAALSATDIKDLKIITTLDVENANIEKADAQGDPILAEKVERKFIFTAQIENPSPALKAKVRELALAETPSYIKTKTVVVVGKRRVAMLLFRKN